MAESRDATVNRRRALKLAAGALAAVPLGAGGPQVPAASPRFFTRAQLALVDELAEILIPADGHSGGARAAGVAAYLDAWLAEAFDAATKNEWISGLDAVDRRALASHGAAFMDLPAAARERVVADLAAEEAQPASPAGRFFVALKRQVVKGYYTSRVGIHDEMGYLGNTLQEEYSGVDVSRG